MKHYSFITFTLFLFVITGLHAQDSINISDYSRKENQKVHLKSPSFWINESYDMLSKVYLDSERLKFDTTSFLTYFKQKLFVLSVLNEEYEKNKSTYSIRTLSNLKIRVLNIIEDINEKYISIHNVNESLVNDLKYLLNLKSEISEFNISADSILKSNFNSTIENLSKRQKTSELLTASTLKMLTELENQVINSRADAYMFYYSVEKALVLKEKALLKRELPPVWQSPPSAYKHNVFDVLSASFIQTHESIKNYIEIAVWQIIIFRLMVFILCLIPIKIFNDKKRKDNILSSTDLLYLGKFPKTATLVMGLALSPLIFIHPPRAFMEIILISLTITVTSLITKNYPKLNKKWLYVSIGAFLVLYLINFFVTPTFIGRLIYTSSILLLIPFLKLIRHLPTVGLRQEKVTRILIYFISIHLIIGWVMVVLGYYTLGRAIILSAYSVLIVSMILRIAIYTFLDYIQIISYFINQGNKSVRINTPFILEKLKPLLILIVIVFIIAVYFINLNILELIRSDFHNFLHSTRTIGSAQFTFISVAFFFMAIYLSFFFAALLRNAFEPDFDQSVLQRSRFGSNMMLIRLLIICLGFIIGVLASGLPLTNFAIFLGALGVGIGFGLQSIVGNIISGLVIAFSRPFVVGDILEFGAEKGKVKEISLRATVLSTTDEADLLIPNNALMSANLKNWTISGKQRCMMLDIQTTHENDPQKVIELITRCMVEQKSLIHQRSYVNFTEITEIGFLFKIKFLVPDYTKGDIIKSELLSTIQSIFASENIKFAKRIPPEIT